MELVPLLVMALLGGAYADAHDRRRLLLLSELALSLCSAALVGIALLPTAPVWTLYVVAAIAAGLSGFQRPALEALTPRLLPGELMPAAASLQSIGRTLGAVGGPALGGVLIAGFGLPLTYAIDCVSFAVCLLAVARIRAVPPPVGAQRPSIARVFEGLRYARSRPDLLGTYLVDINAMFFGMPLALFPAIADRLGGAKSIGLLYAAPAFGAMLVALSSGWTSRVHRHGRAIALAAAAWGLAIIGFGFADTLPAALLFVVLAGAFDMVSGIFRMTMWNQTIPDALRGRLAGIEQISYMSGPLLGDVEAGFVAGLTSLRFSVVSGGVLCVLGTGVLCAVLPAFVRYDDRTSPHRAAKLAEEAGQS